MLLSGVRDEDKLISLMCVLAQIVPLSGGFQPQVIEIPTQNANGRRTFIECHYCRFEKVLGLVNCSVMSSGPRIFSSFGSAILEVPNMSLGWWQNGGHHHVVQRNKSLSLPVSLFYVWKCFQKPVSRVSLMFHRLTLWPEPVCNPVNDEGSGTFWWSDQSLAAP